MRYRRLKQWLNAIRKENDLKRVPKWQHYPCIWSTNQTFLDDFLWRYHQESYDMDRVVILPMHSIRLFLIHDYRRLNLTCVSFLGIIIVLLCRPRTIYFLQRRNDENVLVMHFKGNSARMSWFSYFEDQESIWSAYQLIGVYIYRENCFPNPSFNNQCKEKFPREKGFFWGYIPRKEGLDDFWGTFWKYGRWKKL